jgi:hypothetical protein
LEQTSSHKPTILQAEHGQPIKQSRIDRIFSHLSNESGRRRGIDKHARSFPPTAIKAVDRPATSQMKV